MVNLMKINNKRDILQGEISAARSTTRDLSIDLPSLEPSLEEAVQKKSPYQLEDKAVKKNLEDYRVNITDEDEIDVKRIDVLEKHLLGTTPIRIGKILGFLNSEKDTSYRNTKEYSRDTLEGTYEDVYKIIKMLTDIGWHKGSSQGRSSESTSLNKLMDRKGLILAGDISRFSKKNESNREYPASGLISSIQALRVKGWSENEIKNVAINNRLDDVVYEEYNIKPRETSGATEMERIVSREINTAIKAHTVEDVLEERLQWQG